MKDKEKKTFRVLENEDEEYGKPRVHVFAIVLMIIAGLVIVGGGILLYLRYRSFGKYEVVKTIKIDTISEAEFYEYNGYLLKVSKNGAICQGREGEKIFSVGYEMNEPLVDICDKYITIVSKKGNDIYIIDGAGQKSRIVTNRKIISASVAAQGTVAVLSKEKDSYYINMYSSTGEELVQGAMHIDKTGYPLSITLSQDAKKLAVSIATISKGNINTTINFYNFGAVGQNKIDNLVASYSYEDLVVPRMEFFGKDKMVAVGDCGLIFFKGTEIMEEAQKIKIKATIRSVFFNDSNVGLVCDALPQDIASGNLKEPVDGKKVVSVYNEKGDELMREIVNGNYTKAYFTEDEIVLLDNNRFLLFSLGGVLRMDCTLEDTILNLSSDGIGTGYYCLYSDRIERIKLK